MRIERPFYERDTLAVARDLLGQMLVRRTAEGETRGIITETEAYLGEVDPAAHSYHGKSDRVKVQYGPKGCAYVFLIYGMYSCMNLTSGPPGVPEVVLLRALEPVSGLQLMAARRGTDRVQALCSGPGKLCMAMGIDRSLYGADLCRGDGLWLEPGTHDFAVGVSPRIHIDYAGEARDYPWRFYIGGSRFLSSPRDKPRGGPF